MASRILEQLSDMGALSSVPRPALAATGPPGRFEPANGDGRGSSTPSPWGLVDTPLGEDAPARVGKYAVVGPLGEGGMSVVYRARDEALDRLVALKVMHRHLARDPEARTRFSREARAVARLTHKNIPEIYDYSGAGERDDAGRAYIVSELVDGASLARILREGPPLLPELGVMIVLGAGRALAHAHENQIVHRDVKPENVLVGRDGVVKLTDFGIAHVRGLESMTMTGTLIGSPAHMAPEQIDGTRDLDARVDVWGFGTVLYMVATGGLLPFEADNPHHLLRKVSSGEYQDPRRVSPHVDAELAGIIRRCMTVDRAARYPSLDAVLTDLTRWLEARRLEAPEVEVRAFMADPAGYSALLSRRLVTRFFALGDEALATGDVPRALERFGRVLALDPDHELAVERVRRLERRRRRGKAVALVAAALVVLVAGVLVALVVAAPSPVAPIAGVGVGPLPGPPAKPTLAAVVPPAERTPPAEVVTPAPAAARWGSAFGAALAAEGAHVDEALAELAAARAKAAKPRDTKPKLEPALVTITRYPPKVEVTVAGRTLATGESLPLVPGAYKVVLRDPSCDDCLAASYTLRVPDEAAGQAFSSHFDFVGLPPATLFVRCAAGGYVLDAGGQRYACNVKHRVPVKSEKATLITLSVHGPDGARLHGPSSFTVAPRRPIHWEP